MPHTVILTGVSVLTRLGHALTDDARAHVLLALREAPACPTDLARTFGYSESALDVHLECLLGSGLIEKIEGTPPGPWVRLADPILAPALDRLADLVVAGLVPTGDPFWTPGHCVCSGV